MVETIQGPWTQFQKQPSPKPWEQFKGGAAKAPSFQVEQPAFTSQEPLSFDSVMADYGDKSLTKEDFLADPRLMGLVKKNLAYRFRDGSLAGRLATGALGGATAQGWDSMSDEDLFETWQNYHRSFAGGQSVTTANEIGYVASAEDDALAAMGEGYKLFERMDNAFVGEGSWSESFDAVGDYMSAAIWDPTTVLSLGVGKVFATGGTKAAAFALKETAKAAAEAATKAAIKRGATKAAATAAGEAAARQTVQKGFQTIGKQGAIKGTVAAGGVDLVTAVGTDVAYQDVLMTAGAQEEYSVAQTAISALGMVVTPALIAGGKMAAKGISEATRNSPLFKKYEQFKMDTVGKDPVKITEAMKKRIDLTGLNSEMARSFDNFSKLMDDEAGWTEAKKESRDLLATAGLKANVNRGSVDFFKLFLFGAEKEGEEALGLVQNLAKAGFIYVPRSKDDKVSNWIGDSINWLEPEIVAKAVKGYEASTGVKLGIGYTPETVAAAWKINASDAGAQLLLSSRASGWLKGQKAAKADDPIRQTMQDFTDQANIKEDELPAYGAWGQSVWKRLLTSHPGTTGLNIKGWSQITLMNSASDFVLGMLNFGVSGFKASMGDLEGAKYAMQRGKGSVLGMLRRGYNMLDPMATIEEAQWFLDLNPQVAEQLFKQGAGDTGVGNALKDFNIEGKGFEAVETVVGKAQQMTGVVLQDEVTKMISYMSALDQSLMREYGQTYGDFMAREDVWIEMASKRYQDKVAAPALDRTLRETVSKSWSDKQGGGANWALKAAKFIESLSNNAISGYAIPFGRFFNTATATFGDYTMLNFTRHLIKKGIGRDVDIAEEEGMELLAKGIVGLSAVGIMAGGAMEKIEQGLAWNQEREDDGSIKDVTYDFPESYFRGVAQLLGHKIRDEAVPSELSEEIFLMLGAQTFRASEEGIKAVGELARLILEADAQGVANQSVDMASNFFSGIISGATRPLDPINQAAAMMSGDFTVADRRQGMEFWNQSLRYVDKIFPGLQEEQRASPTKGLAVTPDPGRVLGGNRTAPENTPVERMMNSVGMAPWKAVGWDGDPVVKNRMDEFVAPMLNAFAEKVMEDNPDFFQLSLEKRQYLLKTKVIDPAKREAERMIVTQTESEPSMSTLREIGKTLEKDQRKVLDFLGYEGSLTDIAAEPGGQAKLDTILYLIQNWEDIMLK